MAERVKELETLVMTKEQEIAQFRINEFQNQQKHQQTIDELNNLKKDKEGALNRLDKVLK